MLDFHVCHISSVDCMCIGVSISSHVGQGHVKEDVYTIIMGCHVFSVKYYHLLTLEIYLSCIAYRGILL